MASRRLLINDSYWRSRHGLGTSADRSRGAQLVTSCASEQTLSDLYAQNGLFQTAIGRPIADALRLGFSINDSQSRDPETSNRATDQARAWARQSGALEVLDQRWTQTDIFGGSVLVQITNADQTVIRPDSAAPDPSSRFVTFAPQEITPVGEYDYDPFSVSYGYPTAWSLGAVTMISRENRNFASSREINTTWCRPARTRRLFTSPQFGRQSTRGFALWTGPSAAWAFVSELEHWGISLQAAVSALQTLSQRVLSTDIVQGAQMSPEGQVVVQARLDDIEDRASAMQSIAIDPTETFTIAHSTISGVDQVLDRLMVALAAAARIPITILFGTSPGGFGTGEGERKTYLDRVRAIQDNIAADLEWMLKRVFPEAAHWTVEFPPLDAPTQAEALEMQEKQAQIDVSYVNAAILSPNEVATSRFGGTAYSHETTLDLEERAAAQEAMEQMPDDEEPDEKETAEKGGDGEEEETDA